MIEPAAHFRKRRSYILCVDSDGTVMDTMTIKHLQCLGPCMVAQWHLEPWREEVLDCWKEINLYAVTRGVNRFIGLQKVLTVVDQNYCPIPGLDALTHWTAHSRVLSNQSLTVAIAHSDSPCLKQALCWSEAANRSIHALSLEDKKPFPDMKDALRRLHSVVDIAVISTANRDAIQEEWGHYGLLEYVDMIFPQELGCKADAIAQILHMGYANTSVLMCGDAPGDLEAAEKNEVLFFPILVRHEKESWAALLNEGIDRLLHAQFAGAYQDTRIRHFFSNLGSPDKAEPARKTP